VKLAAAACVLAACGGGPSYLGATMPAACATADAERCAGWLTERDLDAGELDVYADAALRAYVQGITDRLARNTRLAHSPRVVISDHDGTYAPFGDRIVIGRITIEKLGSEAELAAVVAHELVHVEGHHATVSLFGPETDDAWLVARRDAESIADERAVALLERAGYAPAAMPRALAAVLEADDDEHPPRAERIARVAALAANRTQGFEGRRELLERIDHMIVGRDTRLGLSVDNVWVVASLGIALEIPAKDLARSDGDSLLLRHGRDTLDAYAIGAPWAKELASQLEGAASTETALGTVTVGIAPMHDLTDDEPLAKLERAVRATLPQPTPGAWVVILERCTPNAPCGGLVIEIAAHGDAFVRDRWLGGLRAASRRELAAAEPPHITLATAPRAAPIKELVALCRAPAAALRLDNPERVLAAGERFKCTDR
jgi:hypothetical protein